MYVLGVETSCDETSVAIVKNGKDVLSNIVLSQIDIHKQFGGVVPEVASRHHVYNISMVFEEAFLKANLKYEDIDLIAVTEGPGLVGSLLTGITAAKTFAMLYNKPIIGVNHLAGHIYASAIEHEMKFPSITLLVSGGNTELIYMKDHFDFKVIGETLDDACGEAYDKVGRTVGLPYPGGVHVDKLASLGKETYSLPRAMINSGDYNFSFSGLKSAIINLHHNARQKNEEINVNDLCTSFQNTVIDILTTKTFQAAKEYNVKQIIVAGGVSANSGLKKRFLADNKGLEILIPSLEYCTDNAAMIAVAGYYQYNIKKESSSFNISAKSNLELKSIK